MGADGMCLSIGCAAAGTTCVNGTNSMKGWQPYAYSMCAPSHHWSGMSGSEGAVSDRNVSTDRNGAVSRSGLTMPLLVFWDLCQPVDLVQIQEEPLGTMLQ